MLVLRPSRFFQKAIADIGIKLHRNDFKMKVPVSMLQCNDKRSHNWQSLLIFTVLQHLHWAPKFLAYKSNTIMTVNTYIWKENNRKRFKMKDSKKT